MSLFAFRTVPLMSLLLSSMLIGGCASSAPTPAPAPEEPVAVAPSLLVVDASGLGQVSTVGGMRTALQPDVRFGGFFAPATGSHPAMVIFRIGQKTVLSLLSSDGSFETVHEANGEADYTAAWSPTGDLVFGYSGSSRGIGVRKHDGETASAGCSASYLAYGWQSADRLVVGNADNHYVVGAQDCATFARVDSRKLHEEDFNPNGTSVAYVLRELEYDRSARQYVPDSSLWVAGVDGSNPVLVVGNRYKPHRPSWSPDGSELVFDARLPDQPNRRLVSVYDFERGTSAFLNPGSLDANVSEWDAHWSPNGANVAYMQQFEGGAPSVVVRPMDGSFTSLVGESGERFARWIDDRHLVLTSGTGERLVAIDGSQSMPAPEGGVILALQ